MPRPIQIDSVCSSASLDKWLLQLRTNPIKDITLATTLKDLDITGRTALLQFLFTWSKRYPDARLLLQTDTAQKALTHLPNLVHEDHGLVAILVAGDICTANLIHSVKTEAYSFAKSRVEELEKNDWRSPDVTLLCTDRTTKAFIPQLYYTTGPLANRLRKETEVVSFLTRALRSMGERFGARDVIVTPNPENMRNISAIIYELFKNTHGWARTEIDGSIIRRSIRGIRLHFIRVDSDDIEPYPEVQKAYLSRLFQRTHASPEEELAQVLIEISVFDAGPGLAARMCRRTLDDSEPINSEYEAVIKCLELHSTSSSHPQRGTGLMRVMRDLTHSAALLFLRTGRLALYRDFLEHPLRGASDLWLNDWHTGNRNLLAHERVEGAAYSILLPLSTSKARKSS